VGKPADRIALDSDALVVTAKRVGSHADDIRANHMATQASLNDALYGCVGSSGEELGRLSQRWAAVGTRHGERLDGGAFPAFYRRREPQRLLCVEFDTTKGIY